MKASLGIIYDNTIRNNGTAVYCWRALEMLGIDIWHYLPSGQPIKKNAPDYDSHPYYLYIDDGRDDLGVPDLPQPCFYWAIDTHLGYDHRLNMAKQMQHTFCAQKEGAKRLKADGCSASWLPLACHPEAHRLFDRTLAPKCHDIAFVGFMNGDWQKCPEDHHNRVAWLDMLQKNIPDTWIATGLFFEDMSMVYNQAKLGFNISVKNDLNMRFFEILATGTAMLSNEDQDGWDDLGFETEKHFIGYYDEESCVDGAKYYLLNEDQREEIAQAGREKVLQGHTYFHRMDHVLAFMGWPKQRIAPETLMRRFS